MEIVVAMVFGGIALSIGLIFLGTQVLSPKRISTIQEYIRQSKFPLAIKTATHLLAKDPRNSELRYVLGQAFIASGKRELALMEWKTIDQQGVFTGIVREAEFRRRIAELYREFDQDEEALKEYILLIKIECEESDHYYQAGLIFEKLGKLDQAHKYYRKTLDLSPNHSNAHLRMGLIFYRAKRLSEAHTELDLALRFSSENYEAAYYVGKILKESHEYNAALPYFEKALKDPDIKLKALIERGICYLSQQNWERAQAELERAVKLGNAENFNEILHARYFLSLSYENLRDFDSALAEWEFIYEKRPNFKDVAEKLNVYRDMRLDDKIKDYIASTKQDFSQICVKLTQAQGLVARDLVEIVNGVQITAIESDSEQWRNVKKMPKIIQYHRISENIDEPVLRPLADEIQKIHGNRAIIVTNSGFTRAAVTYAETRPFTLISKDGLQALLKKANWTRK